MIIYNYSQLAVLVEHVEHEVDDSVGVAPFVVIPGDEFDKAVVELDSGCAIKDA